MLKMPVENPTARNSMKKHEKLELIWGSLYPAKQMVLRILPSLVSRGA